MSQNIIPQLPDISGTEIKQIPNFPGYAITSNGVLYSCRNRYGFTNWRIAKVGNQRYRRVELNIDGTTFYRSIHRLVLETFVGPAPNGMEACHNNGNSSDNRIGNLRWDTHQNNEDDKEKRPRGSNHKKAKLTEHDVFEIRMGTQNQRPCEIAKKYGISYRELRYIITRKVWIHI
jgi:hypothetical protein